VTLSSCGESGCEPHVAFDGQGDAIVVWEAYNGVHFNVQSAFRAAGGAWQAPVELSSNEAPGTADPQVAVDEQGDAIAIWNRGGPWGGTVQEALRPAGGIWQAPVNIGEEIGSDPKVAFDGQGNALALWQSFEGGDKDEWVLESASMPVGGRWQAPVTVSAPDFADGAHVAVDAQGNAVAVWDGWSHGFLSPRTVQSAFRPAGETWQTPVNLIGEAEERDQPKGASEPGIAVDSQGDAVAIWAWEFGGSVIQAAFRPAGGAWQAPIDLSGFDEYAKNADVAFDDQGNAIAVWSLESSSGSYVIQSAFRPAGGAWQAPIDLSSQIRGAYDPGVAVDGQGDAVAAWAGGAGIEATGYAATGPTLNSVSIPATGTVAQPVGFSVSPLDVWSAPGETTWSFGDGSSASGTNVSHTYTAAGSYQVTLRSADTLGNITSTTGTITIAAAPPPAPPTSGPLSSPSEASTGPASVPPRISTVTQSRSSWRERGRSPLGTTFSLTLNVPATLHLRFMRHATGRMTSGWCRAETARNIRHPPCSRLISAGALSLPAHQGTNSISFRGLLSRSDRLQPGRYTLMIIAAGTAGEPSSARSLIFRIKE
jgi:hypothetical protein